MVSKIWGFINVFSFRATGFYRRVKLFELNFFITKSSGWSNQVSKIILTAGQFTQYPAFKVIPQYCIPHLYWCKFGSSYLFCENGDLSIFLYFWKQPLIGNILENLQKISLQILFLRNHLNGTHARFETS